MRCLLLLLLLIEPVRIQLEPGGVTVEGDVAKDKEASFVFQAKAGQKFSGHLTGKAGFEVNAPDGKGLPEEEFDYNTNLTGTLAKTGDYKIAVATFEPGSVHFKLTVRVY